MKNFLVILITLMLFTLWFLPAYVIGILHLGSEWGVLYIPILSLSLFWSLLLYKENYFS